MAKYRKKPVVIEAIQWDGTPERAEEIRGWSLGAAKLEEMKVPSLFLTCSVIVVRTQHGNAMMGPHDWLIRGVEGEVYPCTRTVFEATYEKAE